MYNFEDNIFKGGIIMSEKGKNKRKYMLAHETKHMAGVENFDETLDIIMEQTLNSLTENEVYPRGRNNNKNSDGTKIYKTPSKGKRYEQDAYTVAQHMVDRTQFRH